MQARTVERIEEWGTRPFSGGVEGLRDLADRGFSGAVDAGPWVFVLNGQIVGVVGGTVEDAGPGTAYVAPHDSLPLLFVMLERGGEQRGRYYTGDTPLADVDETLREGGFTGYLELSENVLSGDYYLVYHGGERRACAFVGQAERLYTGEEAYERAADEVGIYTVTAVDVGVVDLPRTGSGTGPRSRADAAGNDPDTTGAGASLGRSGPDSGPSSRSSATGTGTDPSTDPLGDIEAAGTPAERDDAPVSAPEPESSPTESNLRPAIRPANEAPAASNDAPPATRSGPAPDRDQDREAAADAAPGGRPADDGAPADRTEALRAERAELDQENDRLREELAAERERVADLQSEVRRLEERVRDLRSGGEDGTERTLSLAPEEALSGTSLFVRYDDKGTATLADALAGESEREAVRENLTLEHHTTFDDGAAAVDGDPFGTFLEESLEFGAASWLVREFPYEIRDTGHVDDLGALYEAIPAIDRIELRGSVDAGDESVGFDVVCRDRLGTPLVVVDLHDSRDPAGAGEMEELLESAGTVAEATETLVGAILVTASFFDPPALETAEEVTAGGGLFGGGPTGFVRLSRRVGYHLCLVEARDGRFHVAMPEL